MYIYMYLLYTCMHMPTGFHSCSAQFTLPRNVSTPLEFCRATVEARGHMHAYIQYIHIHVHIYVNVYIYTFVHIYL